jgi:hypothetical protein
VRLDGRAGAGPLGVHVDHQQLVRLHAAHRG